MKNISNKPTVIFFGSKPGSVVALKMLIKQGWKVQFVIPSKHSSDKWQEEETLEYTAIKNNIPAIKQQDIPLDKKVDFVISYMYRYKIKSEILSLAKNSAVNFHPHPLPEYLGYGGYNRAILNNSKEFGCTCHHMIQEYDTGPIVKLRRFSINPIEETAYSLERKTQEEMIHLFFEFCQMVDLKKELPKIPQNAGEQEWFPKDQIDILCKIPDNSDKETIDRFARAFWFPPFNGAFIKINGVRIEIVPELVKNQLGELLNKDENMRLQKIGNVLI
jgi:methionyl-tRNA formyltransferase